MICTPAGQRSLVKKDASLCDRLNDIGNFCTANGLEHIGTCTLCKGLRQGLVIIKRSQDNRANLGICLPQRFHDVDARSIGKLEVDQNHIGADQLGTAQSILNCPGLCNHFKVICTIDNLCNPATNNLMIINDHDSDRGLQRGIVFSHVFLLLHRRASHR